MALNAVSASLLVRWPSLNISPMFSLDLFWLLTCLKPFFVVWHHLCQLKVSFRFSFLPTNANWALCSPCKARPCLYFLCLSSKRYSLSSKKVRFITTHSFLDFHVTQYWHFIYLIQYFCMPRWSNNVNIQNTCLPFFFSVLNWEVFLLCEENYTSVDCHP